MESCCCQLQQTARYRGAHLDWSQGMLAAVGRCLPGTVATIDMFHCTSALLLASALLHNVNSFALPVPVFLWYGD